MTLPGLGAWLAVFLVIAAVPAAVSAAPGQRLIVREAEVAVRAAPRDEGPVVLRVGPEHRLVEFTRREAWVKVGVFGVVGAFGWLRADQVETVPSPVPKPAALPPAPPEPRFRLELSGTPALAYRGQCQLVGHDGGYKKIKLAGFISRSYLLEAAAVSCLVRKWDSFGRLRARLYRDRDLIAAKSTAAAFNHVRLRSAGPWGRARATRGTNPIVRFRPAMAPPAARPPRWLQAGE